MSDRPLGLVLTAVDTIRESRGLRHPVAPSQGTNIESVLAALNSFTDIVRYLNTRRSTGAVLDLSNEAAVQDVLYLMLRPWVLDLVPENPTDKVANRFSIKDFVSQSGKFG